MTVFTLNKSQENLDNKIYKNSVELYKKSTIPYFYNKRTIDKKDTKGE